MHAKRDDEEENSGAEQVFASVGCTLVELMEVVFIVEKRRGVNDQ